MDEPKFCKDCKHFTANHISYNHWCTSPANGFDLVTGRAHSEYCAISREYGPCWKSAKLFVAAAEPDPKRMEAYWQASEAEHAMLEARPRWWEFWK